MAIRNTLLVCAAIVAVGGIAGLSMKPRGDYPQGSYDTSSSSFSAPEQPQAPSYGQASPPSGQTPQYGPPPGSAPSYGPPQPYGSAGASYGPAAAPGSAQPNDPQLVSLSQIDNADRILPRMPVEAANGQRIGEVAQVMMENGRAREIVLDQGTRIPASDLMYAPARSVLVAQASSGGERDQQNGYGPPSPDARGPYEPPQQAPYPQPAPQGTY
jgi:hypothetical protein